MSPSDVVAVYADGGCILRNPSPIGGTWAACHVDAEGKRVSQSSGVILPLDAGCGEVSNNQSEFYALLMGLEALPDGWSGQVCSDSRVTLLRFCHSAKLNGIVWSWQRRLGAVLSRLGKLEPVQLDGHPTKAQLINGVGKRGQKVSEHNVWCDLKCSMLARGFLLDYDARPDRAHAVAARV